MSIMIFFLIAMIFFVPYALKKMAKVYLVVPFFLLGVLIIYNVGLFDKYSFVDSDLIFHKTIVDTLINPGIFENDAVIQYYLKTYPRGYHIILSFLSNFNLSVPQISKLIGMIIALITPFLFYGITQEIFRDKQIAFLGGLFCSLSAIGHTVYSGLPRSIGIVFFLIGLLVLFKIKNDKLRLSYFAALNLVLLLLLIHPHTFIILWLLCIMFFLIMFLKEKKESGNLNKNYIFCFFLLIIYGLACWIFKQKNLINLTSWNFVLEHRQVYYNRVPDAFLSFFKLFLDIGILPIILFILALGRYKHNPALRKKYPNLFILFSFVFFLIISTLAIMHINQLFFLKAHRFPMFITLLMYLSSVWILKDIWVKIEHEKVLALLFGFILFTPSAIDLRNHIQAPKLPYDLDGICLGISDPGESELDFSEILDLSDFIKNQIPKNEMIACALDRGDILRMYVNRPVTSSWEIGGMITTYKDAFFIYQQQIADSKMLYEHPEQLYTLYGVRYFLFEKSKLKNKPNILTGFVTVWQSANLYFCKIII